MTSEPNKSTVTIDGVQHDINTIDIRISTVQNPPPPPPPPPTGETKAKISNADQTAEKGDVVVLDGSGSTSATTGIRYLWTQTEGLGVIIGTHDKAIASFTAVEDGDYGFSLTVMDDNDKHDSATCKVKVKTTEPIEKDPGLPPKDGWFEQLDKGANKDPHTWQVVPMTKDPALSKVVDNKRVNRAVEFKTSESADRYKRHFVYVADHPENHECPPGYHWDVILAQCVTNEPNCPEGQHWDGERCVDDEGPPGPPNPPPSGDKIDQEGIAKIYEDDTTKSQQQFFMTKDGLDSPRVEGKGARTKQSDGSWKISPDKGTNPPSARIYIQTTNSKGYDIETQLVNGKDWQKMINLPDPDGVVRGGWMVDNFDWRDTELSYYWKIPKLNEDDQMTNYIGGRHPGDVWPDECVSSCYKAQLETQDISPRGAIEWDHMGGSTNYAWNDEIKPMFDLKGELGGTVQGKLIGQKYVRYNVAANGKVQQVVQELYIDTASKDLAKPDLSKQNWRLFARYMHDGTNWPSKPKTNERVKECNAAGITMPAFGAPTLAMRFDASDWIIYNLSARPINPTQKLVQLKQEESPQSAEVKKKAEAPPKKENNKKSIKKKEIRGK